MTGNQRWRDRRDSYRPVEPIDTARYEVSEIPDDNTAKAFILQHHYSGSYPAARFRFGLYRGQELAGVAVFSTPMNNATITNVAPVDPLEGVELGRFVLLDDVPGNGETWFLARCFELLREEDLSLIVSFSDPVPRTSADGTTVFGGHIGTIYQAHNAVYLGRANTRTHRLLPSGQVLSPRAIQKLRTGVKGWRYTAEILQAAGAPAPGADLKAWADHWIPQVTRPLRHGGNHKYVWAIERRLRKHLPKPQAYPKQTDLIL
jgi:hypothetical protein